MPDDRAKYEGWGGFVAWEFLDGNTMVGKIKCKGMTSWSWDLIRLDGSWVVCDERKLRPATADDVRQAAEFYVRLGA